MSILTRDMWLEILEQRMERPLIQLLDELGGWPILRPNWDPEKFDWLLLVAQLRLYNNDILISEWVAPDIKNSDQYVIQVEILRILQIFINVVTIDILYDIRMLRIFNYIIYC